MAKPKATTADQPPVLRPPQPKAAATDDHEAAARGTALVTVVDDKAAAPLPRQSVQINAELKRSATVAFEKIGTPHLDDLEEAHIETVSLKYDRLESAQRVAQAVARLAEHLEPRQCQLQKPKVVAEADRGHGRVGLPLELVVPGCFDDLIVDIATTSLELLEVYVCVVEAAHLFCSAFQARKLICIDLVPNGDHGKTPECRRCEREVPAVFEAILGFAEALSAAAAAPPCHRVTIEGTELGNLKVRQDGESVNFGKHNAALRALLALALLREQPAFSTEEFARLYLGASKPSGDPGKTLNNAMNELGSFFAQVGYQVNRGKRSVTGLSFQRVPEAAEIRTLLQFLYRD